MSTAILSSDGGVRRRRLDIKRSPYKPAALEVLVENLPAEMRDLRRFVAWHWVYHQGRGWDKPPLNPRTGNGADCTAPGTWVCLDEALSYVQAGKADGVGFCLGNGWAGVDLDDCVDPDTGILDPWARDIINRLGTYSELSPSKTGCKLFFKNTVLPTGPRKMGLIEFYDSGRYFTLTGHRIAGNLVDPQQGQCMVATLYAEMVRDHAQKKSSKAKASTSFGRTKPGDGSAALEADEATLIRLGEDLIGRRFTALWDGSTAGYPSASEADLALCNYLAWLCGAPDSDRVDRMFRRSGLMRPKWDERRRATTYGAQTVTMALNGRTDYWQPHTRQGCRSSEPIVGPVSEAREHPAARQPVAEEYHTTDLGNAKRVIERHGSDLRYCWAWKQWLVWDGRRWHEDDTAEVVRRIKDTEAALFKFATGRLESGADNSHGNEREALVKRYTSLLKHCTKWESAKAIRDCLDLMRSEPSVPILQTKLDTDPWTLNVLNGTLDLRTGKLRSHQRQDYLTKLVPVEYREDVRCPTWEKFLSTVMGGKVRLIEYLQRVAGYCLTGDVSEQSLWFFHGAGANGKSTFLMTLLALMGDYGLQAVSDLLLAKNHEAHPTERADLMGRRLVATIEAEQGKRLAEALMKQLTGGDRVRARKMRQDFFEFDATHKIILCANHKPVVRGQDHGVWRRIKLVPFTVTIPDSEKDPHLLDKLKGELPGILAWAVRGCLSWQQGRMAEPDEVKIATADYRAEQDLLAGFLDEVCILCNTAKVQCNTLYEAYRAWSGDGLTTRRGFSVLMTTKGYRSIPGGGNRKFYHGIGLQAGEFSQKRRS